MTPLSLSDRLKALGVKTGATEVTPPAPKVRHPIEEVLPGRLHASMFGEAFLVENFPNFDYAQYGRRLSPPQSLQAMAAWAGAPKLPKINAESFVFLDTETTGLAGGTGTYPFLVGIGHYRDGNFSLAQIFMRNPAEEAACLAALSELLANDGVIVTYNGKAFDAPLLATRFTLQGMSNPIREMVHLDLLPLARRLWRNRLPSRTLGYVESSILRVFRSEEEIPGWMIPQLYFDYLQNGDARPMKGVLYHNAMDIVSLAALFFRMDQMLDDPIHETEGEMVDLVAIGRLYEDLGQPDIAAYLYKEGLDNGLPEPIHWDTLQRLAALHKRQEHIEVAAELWVKAAEAGQIYAFVELAKYYEHQAKDLSIALEWTGRAIDALSGLPLSPFRRGEWLRELEHRQERLNRLAGTPQE